MGVKVTNRTYTNPYRAETTSYLRANTGDWINVELEVESEVRNDYTLTNTVSFVSQNRLINLNGSEWRQQGFDVGDTITIRFSYNGIGTPAVNTTRVILDIQGSELTYDSTDIIPQYTNILPSSTSVDSGGGTYVTVDIVDVIVSADKRPASLDFEYGLISNQDFSNPNLASFVDNSTITFRESGLDTLVGSKTLTQLGLKSGLGLANPTIEYVGVTSFRYKYIISFDMFINSFFEEDLNGVENGVYPEVLLDSNALTDNFKFAFQPEDGNPNVVIKSEPQLTKQLGNTGWLDESYNGNENDFVVDSITYEDTLANPLTELDYANATVVKATISGVPNLGVGTSDFSLGFIYLPKQETEFKELKTQYHENLYVNTCGVNKTFSLVANGGGFDATVYNGFTKDDAYVSISDIRFQVGSDPLTIEVQYTVTPNASWNTKMEALSENNRAYGLWISCADRTLTTTASDRVSLLLDTNLMTLQPVQLGSYPGLTNKYIANYEEQADAGNSTANVFPQDNFASKLSFTNDLTDNITINSIDFRVELVHASDGRKYELDSFIADLTSQPIDSNDVQQFAYLGSRGFLIDESTNDKNLVEIVRDATLDAGSVYGYSAYCGLKSRYEDWIERTDLPSEVYDVLESNDGYNNFWFYLDSLTDWSVKYVVQIGADADGVVGVYRNEFDIAHKDYDSNANITVTPRFYRQLDNTLINDAILKRGEIVRLEVDFTLLVGFFSGFASDLYVEFQIEENDGGGWKTAYQFSNVHKTQPSSPFLPLDTYTYLKTEGEGTATITASCLIDGDKMPVSKYRVSAEIKTPLSGSVSSILFDGVDEFLNVGDNLNFTNTDELTYSAWIKINSFTSSNNICGKFGGGTDGIILYVAPSGVVILFARGSAVAFDYTSLSSTNTLSASTWYHIVLTKSTNIKAVDFEIYINGVKETKIVNYDTFVTGDISNNYNFNIGAHSNSSNYFDGYIDETSVFDKELSASEVSEIYNSGCPSDLYLHSAVKNLQAWWRMGEGDGDSISLIYDQMQRPYLELDGVNEYMIVPNSVDLHKEYNEAFSISAWINPSLLSGTFFIWRDVDATARIVLFYDASTQTITYGQYSTFDTAPNRLVVTYPFPNTNINRWYNIVFTKGTTRFASSLDFYINNVAQTQTIATNNASTNSVIGSGDLEVLGYSGGLSVNGGICHLAYWDKKLSGAEVTTIFEQERYNVDYSSVSGLVSWWKMEKNIIFPNTIGDSYGSNDGAYINGEETDFKTDQFNATPTNMEEADLTDQKPC